MLLFGSLLFQLWANILKQKYSKNTKVIVHFISLVPILDKLKQKLNQLLFRGLKDYFSSTLGSQLLYKFERIQYMDILKVIHGELSWFEDTWLRFTHCSELF